jgi:hypothetical protein
MLRCFVKEWRAYTFAGVCFVAAIILAVFAVQPRP